MLQSRTVAPALLAGLNELMKDDSLNTFLLVGGTALALQLGHRVSVDIDFFSKDAFNTQVLAAHLSKHHPFTVTQRTPGFIMGFLNSIKLDLIHHAYPWIAPPIITEGIRMASLADIAAMKLNAIVDTNQRVKDFIDIVFLSTQLSLHQMIEAYLKKYPGTVLKMAYLSLTWFDGMPTEPFETFHGTLTHTALTVHIQAMVKSPQKIFSYEEINFS